MCSGSVPWACQIGSVTAMPSIGRSIDIDSSEADNLGPFSRIVCDELLELIRRTRKGRAAKIGKARNDLRLGKATIDLTVEPFDDIDGRALGRTDPEPDVRIEAVYEISHRCDVGEHLRAGRGGHG